MKKLLGTTLALAMFIPAGANAELLKNFKVSGNLDIQTVSARNVTDFVTRPTNSAQAAPANNDRIGHAHTRVMVKMDWDLLDDVHSRVTLVKGAEGGAGTSRVYGAAANSLDALQTAVSIEEANVKIDKVFGLLDVTAGRQFYGEEGDLIIYYGPRDAHGQRVNALDIFRADWNGEHMSVTGIAGKTADTTVAGVANAATDLRGVVVSCKMHEMVKPSAYVYNRVTHATDGIGRTLGNVAGSAAGKNTNLWVVGAKAKVATGGFSGSLELAKNFGEDRTTFAGATNAAQAGNFKGYAVQLKAGYKADLSDVGTLNPWGEYGLGTGDSNFDYKGNNTFQSIATDYRPGGIYGRFDSGAPAATVLGNGVAGFNGASNGLSNRIIWGLGVKATPAALNKLTAGVAFYRYAFHRNAPYNAAGQKLSRNIGSEINVTGEWKHSENVTLKAGAGSFQPGAYVADLKNVAGAAALSGGAALNPAVMLSGDVSIKF